MLANTTFMKREELRWTHTNNGSRTQIDYICVEQRDRRWVTDAESSDDICLGNDHRAVKMTMRTRLGSTKRYLKSKKKPMVGWQPQEPEVYASLVSEAITHRVEDTAPHGAHTTAAVR